MIEPKYYKVSEQELLMLLAEEAYLEALADGWASVDPMDWEHYDEYMETEFMPVAKKMITNFEEVK